jgi:hypothetical protein
MSYTACGMGILPVQFAQLVQLAQRIHELYERVPFAHHRLLTVIGKYYAFSRDYSQQR